MKTRGPLAFLLLIAAVLLLADGAFRLYQSARQREVLTILPPEQAGSVKSVRVGTSLFDSELYGDRVLWLTEFFAGDYVFRQAPVSVRSTGRTRLEFLDEAGAVLCSFSIVPVNGGKELWLAVNRNWFYSPLTGTLDAEEYEAKWAQWYPLRYP